MSPTFDAYDRARLVPSVVHIGPGVFHRAHQAVYCDDLLRTGATDAAIGAISLRSSAVRDALAPDAFTYHVVEVADRADGGGAGESIRQVGALVSVDDAAADVELALARLTAASVCVVTITVTEHGYCAVHPGGPLDLTRPEIVHDLATPAAPRSLPGLVVEALVRRRAAGLAPFTVVSCDNIASNGVATARVITDLAEHRGGDLAAWIAGNVAFPSSMVDRMVPATTAAEVERCRRLGVGDAWPIVTEPFRQWVLEDQFPEGRPAWDRVGVELVGDVSAHEQAKLRILNAAHSALAYWGLLAGHELIWQAVADPVLRTAVTELLEHEAIPTIEPPPGWDLTAYAASVLERFANRALPYTTAKVASDGSQKLRVRLLPTIRAARAVGRPTPRSEQVLAAWVAVVAGPHRARFRVADPALAASASAASTVSAAEPTLDPREAVQGLGEVVALDDVGDHDVVDHVVAAARALWHTDVRQVLASPATAVTTPAVTSSTVRSSTVTSPAVTPPTTAPGGAS